MQSLNQEKNSQATSTITSQFDQKRKYYENFGALIYLNIILLLLQSFTSSGKNILQNVFRKGDYTFLGPTQYICNYFFGPLTLLIVETLIVKFRFKYLFYFSSFCQNLFLLGGLVVTFCTDDESAKNDYVCQSNFIIGVSVTSSIFAGILQTVYYVTFISFINSVSNEKNKGFYYGISYSLSSASSVVANILGYILLNFLSNFQFYLLVIGVSLFLQLLLLFVVDVRASEIQQERTALENLIYQFTSIKNEITNYKFRKLFIFLCFAGLMNSVIYIYQPVMTLRSITDTSDTNKEEQLVFIVFFVSGMGSIMGGTTAGKLCERFNRIHISYAMLAFVIIGNSFSLISFIETKFYIACFAAFFFGFSDSSCSSLGLTILTKEISKTNHVFAAFNLCQSIGFGIPSVFWLYFSPKIFYWDIGFVYCTAIITVLSLIYYDFKVNHFQTPQARGESQYNSIVD